MPATQRNPITRFILTLVLFLIAGGFVVSTIFMSNKGGGSGQQGSGTQQTSATTSEDEQGTPPGSEGGITEAPATVEPAEQTGVADVEPETLIPDSGTDAPQQARTSPEQAPADTGEMKARVQSWSDPAHIGSIDLDGEMRVRLRFTPWGAGIEGIDMANYFVNADVALEARRGNTDAERYSFARSSREFGGVITPALSARGMFIGEGPNRTFIDLFSAENPDGGGARVPVWREMSPGAFECIVERDGEPAIRLTRRFSVTPGSYEIGVEQFIENLTDRPLTISLVQYGPSDLDEEYTGYRIDSRRIRFGYIPQDDPSEQFVQADSKLLDRARLLKDTAKAQGVKQIWEWPEQFPNASELSWVGQTNRYFAFVIHPQVEAEAAAANMRDPVANPVDKSIPLVGRAYARVLGQLLGNSHEALEQVSLAIELETAPRTIEPGSSTDLSFGVYAGPLSQRILNSRNEPIYRVLNLDGLIIYQIGMCGICTFQWLGQLLFRFLMLLHDYVVFDWALAILVLVLCVRAAIHPITKKSQISMMRFGKQMQRIQPKIKKLQEKYKDQPKVLQQEQMRLMREERVNYAGALGCLPLLLQTPIWIALYAMLYFAFELRHQPAFFGLFQAVSGNQWLFLSDLSSPDRFIQWGGNFGIPLVEGLMGPITGLNIIPILMGIVFYFHMKYMTPPSTGNLTPEQEQTQKIMRVMMVVMMPVFMYNAPAGLTLYIATSSLFGIMESRYIRSHVDKLDLEGPPPQKKPGVKSVRNEAKKPKNPFAKKRDTEDRDRFKKRK